MAKGHAISGAASWVVGCAAASWAAGRGLPAPEPTWSQTLAGAVICAGAALLPDIDHPNSTIARSFGPASRALSWIFARLAAATRRITCAHCLDLPKVGGHRALSHTLLFALAVGVGVGALAAAHGQPVAVTALAAAAFLVSYPALGSAGRAKLGDLVLPDELSRLSLESVTGHDGGRSKKPIGRRLAAFAGSVVLAAVPTAILQRTTAGVDSWWWVGVAVGWGTLAHTLGDLVTKSAVPLLWPLKIGTCRWKSVGPPRWMRITTGGRAEQALVFVLSLLGLGGMAFMLDLVRLLAGISEGDRVD